MRFVILGVLANMGVMKPVIFQELVTLLKSEKDWEIRREIVKLLGYSLGVGSKKWDKTIVLTLAKIMKEDKDQDVRYAATSILRYQAWKWGYYDEIQLIHEYEFCE